MATDNHVHSYLIDGQRFEVEISTRDAGELSVRVNGRMYRVQRAEPEVAAASEEPLQAPPLAAKRSKSVAGELRAPMAGRVLAIAAQVGDEVAAGAALVVLDAMKMENTLQAPRAGEVVEIAVRPGDTVLQGALLVRLR